MKAAVDILLGSGEGKIAAGEEIPTGKFTDEQIEGFKAAGAIEGEGPAAEPSQTGPGPVPAEEEAEAQAESRAAPQPAGETPKAGPPKTAGGEKP